MANLSTAKRRLLIVDDNPEIHADIKKILESGQENEQLDDIESMMFGAVAAKTDFNDQFEIDDAYQGQEALALVQQSQSQNSHYDVAIVDMRMPPG